MRWLSNVHLFGHPWESVSAANWTKYPSEVTPHVTNVDYLSRRVDPATGILHTERLITCKQSAPAVILKLLGGSSEAYIYEASECDPQTRILTLRTKNLTFSNIMTIEESCTYVPSDINPSGETVFRQEASIASLNGFSTIRNKLEEYGLERFRSNALKGKEALEGALARLCQETKLAVAETIEAVENAFMIQGSHAPSGAAKPDSSSKTQSQEIRP